MEFILWLERKWLQLSPEFEQWAQKYAQEIKEKRFHGGKLPVQSPGKALRWVPLVLKKLPQGKYGVYDPSMDTMYVDPSQGRDIYSTIAHEGIHAFDPKTNIAPFQQEYAKKVVTTAKPGTPEYFQLPAEFEATGGGDIEYFIKHMVLNTKTSLEKRKNINELKDWLRTGKTPPTFGNFTNWVANNWNNNPKLWRQFKEKFYTALERAEKLLSQVPQPSV